MPAAPTLRFADPESARRYPLPADSAPIWRGGTGAWVVELPLADLGPGTLLVPSLALPGDDRADRRYRWTLAAGDEQWPLQPVPAERLAPPLPPGSPVSAHIDCYRVHRAIAAPVLLLELEGPRAPQRYLICVSRRPFTLGETEPARRAVGLVAPPQLSQMSAPAEIAARICSPTCVSMVLALWQRHHDWLALVAECHDPATGTYGVWPLALAAAARRGIIAAVEAFSDWNEPLAVLERGVPLVTSIRFDPGGLPGAPLAETHGHLVVVHAAGPEHVDVCDPAAPAGDVLRRYPAGAFSRAWLRQRGAAYILAP